MGNNSPPQILLWLRFFFVVSCIFHFLVPPTNIGFDEAEKSFGTFRTLRQEREESQKPSEIVEIWSRAIPHYVQRALQCQDSASLHIFRHIFFAHLSSNKSSWIQANIMPTNSCQTRSGIKANRLSISELTSREPKTGRSKEDKQ